MVIDKISGNREELLKDILDDVTTSACLIKPDCVF